MTENVETKTKAVVNHGQMTDKQWRIGGGIAIAIAIIGAAVTIYSTTL